MSAVTAPARASNGTGIAAGLPPRVRRLWRGPERDPAWARPALLGLLAVVGVLYLVNLSANAYANDFYAAAVQAGTKSWKAFFFGSFDASNAVTVDKSPLFLWPMELSARVFGLSSWSMLVPQALEGVAAVGVLYLSVRRWFSAASALLAGAVLALKNKQIDGLVVDLPTAFYMTGAQLDDKGTVVGQFQLPSGADVEHFGVVLAKGSSLTPCVNGAIEALTDDGTLAAITTEWLSEKVKAPVFTP